jgi:hypothetical protein
MLMNTVYLVKHSALLLLILAAIGISTVDCDAQPLVNPIPFQIPLDGINEHPLLNNSAGQINGYLQKNEQGHFIDAQGNRVRLFGISLFYAACFPDSADAPQIARRLRSLGFNAVRLHGIDHAQYTDGSIIEPGNSTERLNTAQMRRLDWFIWQLAEQGIRIYLPLHTEWLPRGGDAIPGSDSLHGGLKGLLYTQPAYRDRLSKIWTAFFNHTNPYFKKPYKQIEALSMIDLSTSNSLFSEWRQGRLFAGNYQNNGISTFHAQRLDSIFNAFILRKYPNRNALAAAWNNGPYNFKNLIGNGGFENEQEAFTGWDLYVNYETSSARLFPSDGNKTEGKTGAWIRITKAPADSTSWHIQFMSGTPRLKRLRAYELSFQAKTSAETAQRPLEINIYNSQAPYNSYGLQQRIMLTADWKKFTLPFRSLVTDSMNVRLAFMAGQQTGDIYLDDIVLKELEEPGLLTQEDPASRNVFRSTWAGDFSPARMRDNVEFYTQLQQNYYQSMIRLLRDTLGCKALLNTGADAESANDAALGLLGDFTSDGSGWDWIRYNDQGIWFLPNQSVLFYPGGIFPGLANSRLADRPFVVSNYITPWPSAHMNEMMTLLPVYAAYQDWDGLFLTYYADGRWSYNSSAVDSLKFFELKNIPSLMGMAPAASAAFRKGNIMPAKESIEVNYTKDMLDYPPFQLGYAYLPSYTPGEILLFRKYAMKSFNAAETNYYPALELAEIYGPDGLIRNEMATDTRQIVWNADDGIVAALTDNYCMAHGLITNKVIDWGHTVFELRSGKSGSVILQSDTNLKSPGKSLLTLSSRSGNTGQVWTQDITTFLGWGRSPVLIEGMDCRIIFNGVYDSVIIWPLDNLAKRTGNRVIANRVASNVFSVNINQAQLPSMWFDIEKKPAIISSVQENNKAEQQEQLVVIQQDANPLIIIPAESEKLIAMRSDGTEICLWKKGMSTAVYIPESAGSGLWLLKLFTSQGVQTASCYRY